MMSYRHTKFHENRISSFRGVAMTRFWDGQMDRRTDRRNDCTPRPAFAFGDAGKNWQGGFDKTDAPKEKKDVCGSKF